jgi:uncharacterized Zn finger protein (UPF0148 family)
MPEILLLCPGCQEEFVFSEDEQAQCAEQAFPPPTFCPACYRRRKEAKEEERDRQRRGSKRRRR